MNEDAIYDEQVIRDDYYDDYYDDHYVDDEGNFIEPYDDCDFYEEGWEDIY